MFSAYLLTGMQDEIDIARLQLPKQVNEWNFQTDIRSHESVISRNNAEPGPLTTQIGSLRLELPYHMETKVSF